MAAHVWDSVQGRYLLPNGQPVPSAVLRAAVRTVVDDSADRLALLAQRLQAGRLDVLGWRVAVRGELKTASGVASSLARGGVAQMTPSDRGFLGGQLRAAYSHLDVFALDVSQGRIDLASDAFAARARMYSGTAHSAHEAFVRRGAEQRGESEEMNELESGSQHCDGCQGEADRGWVSIGELSLPGERDCIANCRCQLITRRASSVEAEAAA